LIQPVIRADDEKIVLDVLHDRLDFALAFGIISSAKMNLEARVLAVMLN
jgi:hypothetical protein